MGVPGACLERVRDGAEGAGLAIDIATLEPSERNKTLDTFRDLVAAVVASGHTRSDPVIALGGGIVGDLAGFVAASVMRGVPIVQCPTTLLAMVDASVGGKTGVNLEIPAPDSSASLLKNMVGAFHQPIGVLADIDTLDSLGPRHFRAGLAECAKHACIAGDAGRLLDWTLQRRGEISARELGTLAELVERNIALKASVVERDERESDDAVEGGRMLLNFGHTYAHAIETIAHLSPDPDDPSRAPLHHGEAVALGMLAATHTARRMGLVEHRIADEIGSLVEALGLPTRVRDLPDRAGLLDRMARDKKARGGALRLVLPVDRGRCVIVDDAPFWAVREGLDAIAC